MMSALRREVKKIDRLMKLGQLVTQQHSTISVDCIIRVAEKGGRGAFLFFKTCFAYVYSSGCNGPWGRMMQVVIGGCRVSLSMIVSFAMVPNIVNVY